MFETVEPEITPGKNALSDTVETHPSYAQISASRVSGGARLYGSDFVHQHYVTISIGRSELHRGLSRDWAFCRDEIVEVALSEAQWATFVSSMNVGGGTQCTLQHIDRQSIPQIPEVKQRKDQFAAEMSALSTEGREALDQLAAMIGELKISEKAKKELAWKVELARRSTGGSAKFINDQFGEFMEETIEKAKIEVNAYAIHTLQRAGLKALTGDDVPIKLLPDKSEPMVSYLHEGQKDTPDAPRFRQPKKDPLPKWAADVRDEE